MELQQHVMSHGAGKREGHRLLLPSVYPRLHTHFTRCSRLLTSACPFGPRDSTELEEKEAAEKERRGHREGGAAPPAPSHLTSPCTSVAPPPCKVQAPV
ncbi:hypothetical protein FQA47_013765 [Oryzias melastigma]|uniref:Uncharacterized protein n=1 Tax=Oryzias melastigma TaxID=30732 RepID=A0A834F626_ORYME|nr:hypothetical protein FQA47_013765 [Oryzias melastigma]